MKKERQSILLTGGRAPCTLDLARLFSEDGHRVYIAESFSLSLCRFSKNVEGFFNVPSARLETSRYIEALQRVIRDNHIDLLIPTCEEIFFIAQNKEALEKYCQVLLGETERVFEVHNKWTFIELSQKMHLSVPKTWLLKNKKEANKVFDAQKDLVFKPVYSRFGSQTLIKPQSTSELPQTISEEYPWVAQEWVEGKEISSYAIAQKGEVRALSLYTSIYKWGQGAGVGLQSLREPTVEKWIEDFVRSTNWTGQIAFDFIITKSGSVFAIECNPRNTSGVHFFSQGDGFVDACLGNKHFEANKKVYALPGQKKKMSLPLLFWSLPQAILSRQLLKWLKFFIQARDVLWVRKDSQPFFAQFLTLFFFLRMSLKWKVNPTEASTYDIEWNGVES